MRRQIALTGVDSAGSGLPVMKKVYTPVEQRVGATVGGDEHARSGTEGEGSDVCRV